MDQSPSKALHKDSLQRQILHAEDALRHSISESLKQFNRKVETSMHRPIDNSLPELAKPSKQGHEKTHVFRYVARERRQSLLTELMHIKDYKTIYNMVAASFVPLTIMIVVDNLTRYGELLDLNTFNGYFLLTDKTFICWWVLAFINYSVIPLVYFTVKAELARWIWIPLYILHQATLLLTPTIFVEHYRPGFATSIIIMIEGARMMMKSHSYLRNKLLYCTANPYRDFELEFVSGKEQKKPTFTVEDMSTEIRRYSYFFVCPTLIYRDSYMLTPRRNFARAFVHFANFLICLYYGKPATSVACMVYSLCCKDVIEMLGKHLTWTQFCMSVLRLMLPSMLFLILGFFGFLHSWLNGWAELTRFPDRVFYQDWWNSIEFGTYYRKWNIVVHDWLYYYVYLDFCRFVMKGKRSRTFAKILTFLISAVMHELILVEATGFFYPVLFLMFTGPGIILIQNQKKLKFISINFFFWIELYLGTSLLFVLYLTEYYARSIISSQRIAKDWGFAGFLIPRTLYL